MHPPAAPAELAAFAARVRGHGRGRPRRVLAVAAAPSEAAALGGVGLELTAAASFAPGVHPDHAWDGVWFGPGALPADPDQAGAWLNDVCRTLHHGFVRVPVDRADPADRWRLELLLERANLRVVESHAGLIAWTKLVPPLIGAGATVFDDRGRLLLTDRADGWGWCLPGGVCDPDESPQQTVVREVREETGLEVEIDRLLGVYSSRNRYGRIVVVEFLCRVVGGRATVTDETVDFGWFREDELPDRLIEPHRVRIHHAFAVERGQAAPPFVHDTEAG